MLTLLMRAHRGGDQAHLEVWAEGRKGRLAKAGRLVLPWEVWEEVARTLYHSTQPASSPLYLGLSGALPDGIPATERKEG